MSRREFNTPHRECWNAPIHQILKAIDNHTRLYLQTQDVWHLKKSQILREYVADLKTWIHHQESLDENL